MGIFKKHRIKKNDRHFANRTHVFTLSAPGNKYKSMGHRPVKGVQGDAIQGYRYDWTQDFTVKAKNNADARNKAKKLREVARKKGIKNPKVSIHKVK